MNSLVREFESAGIDPDSVAELKYVHDEITKNFIALNSSVERRLRQQTRREVAVNGLGDAHARFLEVLTPLVDDAVFDMVISSEDLTTRSSDAITELVDGGVLVLNQLMAISAEANLTAGLLTEAAFVSDPTFLQPLQERFIASAGTIARNLRELPDSADKLKLQHVAGALLRIGTGVDNIFEVRERELREEQIAANIRGPDSAGQLMREKREKLVVELKAAHRALIETLHPIVDDATFSLVISSEDIASQNRQSITRLVDGGVNTLRLLLSMRAEGNLAVGLLVESASLLETSLIPPLHERFTAAASHVEKQLNQLSTSVDRANLRDTASALLAYGKGPESLFELRRRELETIGTAKGFLDTSQQLAVRLSDEVAGLVLDAKSASDQASTRSTDAIQDGKLLLLLIMAISIVGAAVIMVSYVARRVVRPLQSMTTAMSELAEGDTTVDIPAQARTDEVGDMAKALKVFRDTAIEIQKTNLREIREARRHLTDAIESISEGFSLYGRDDRLVVFNTRYRQIVFPGMHDIVTPGTSFETLLRELVERGIVVDAEDGVEEWIEERLARHRNPGGSHIQRRSDGRWLRITERKTEDGGTVAVYTDITEDKEAEQALKEKTEYLQLNQIITRAANEAQTVEQALQIALDQVCGQTGWPVGHVYMPAEDDSNDLVPTTLWHLDDPKRFETFRNITEKTRFAPGVGLPGRVLQNEELAWIADVTQDVNFPRAASAADIGVKGAFAFPVLVGREVVAVLEFFATEVVEPYESLIDVMRQVGVQLGRVIERTRSEEQLHGAKEAAEADRERAEQALQELTQTQQSLIYAEKLASLGQLTAGIAHEIKNPLNFVNNFSESAAEVIEELRESIEGPLSKLGKESREDVEDQFAILLNFLSKIKEHGKRADGIVKSMLAHASEGSGEVERTDLNGLIDETLNLCYHSARAEHRDFNVEFERELDPKVGKLDIITQEITRVLLNLIGNGFYALYERQSNGEDPDYHAKLKVATRDLGEQVEVRIRDNGTGIPAAAVDKIFNPFYTTKPTGEGTGLGLSLSYETVVKQHQGQMEVDTREGEYTEFIITLPRKAIGESADGEVG